MNTLSIVCPSTGAHERAVDSWTSMTKYSVWPRTRATSYPREILIDDTTQGVGAGYLNKLERGWEKTHNDIIAYFHSDIYIHDYGWDVRVLEHFLDPSVAVVSFIGAKGLGRSDIYQAPYDFRQLVRSDVISNMEDAEMHGRREFRPQDVAMIDSFSCIVRRSFLDDIGGWLISGLEQSHCSDNWICLMAHRHHRKVRYVPIRCAHTSGGVRGDGKFDYAKWCEWYGKSDAQMHQENHRKLYDQFKDVLPVRIP